MATLSPNHMPRIRLVTFDVLHTLITPRLPIHVQYSEAFRPYLGLLEPDAIRASFKVAVKSVQKEFPAYQHGATSWWAEVIRRTALGAGADPHRVTETLNDIVPVLLKRFSSQEGYKAFDDAIPAIKRLNEAGIQAGIVSNGDSRFRLVLEDLGFQKYIELIVLSEESRVEKPNPDIFMWALKLANAAVDPEKPLLAAECFHVGDELEGDYLGATSAGFRAVLLRRIGSEGEQAHKEDNEDLQSVPIVRDLHEVVDIVMSSLK